MNKKLIKSDYLFDCITDIKQYLDSPDYSLERMKGLITVVETPVDILVYLYNHDIYDDCDIFHAHYEHISTGSFAAASKIVRYFGKKICKHTPDKKHHLSDLTETFMDDTEIMDYLADFYNDPVRFRVYTDSEIESEAEAEGEVPE